MYGIIVFTHGLLAENLVRASQLILGSQPDIEIYCVEPGYNLEEMENEVGQSIQRSNASGQEILVPTGLMCGTPFNTIIRLEEECSLTHITGINLPLLIETTNHRLADRSSESFGELVDVAREGIIDSHVLLQVS